MSNYYKPQTPLVKGDDFIYPLTTVDQVLLADGSRLNAKVVMAALDDAEDGEDYNPSEVLVNAETLGGKPASDYMLKVDTATNSNKLGGKAPEYYLTPVNLFVNIDFEIAQAGYNAMHGNEYFCADRWNGTNNEITLSKKTGYITLTSTVDYRQIYQKILVSDLVADTYTFATTRRSASVASSLYLYGENANGNFTAIKSVSMSRGDEWQTFVLNFTRAEVAQYTKIWCCIRNQATGAVDYKEPGLYPGTYTAETLPLVVPRKYAVELAECKRRFQIIGGENSYGYIGTAVAVSATQLRMGIQIPVEMAEAPDVHAYGNLLAVNSAFVPITDVIFNVSDTTSAMVYLNVAGGLTPGETYIIMANNDGTARIELDSDL